MNINNILNKIDIIDKLSVNKAAERLDSIAKPIDSLGLLEEGLKQIAGIRRTADFKILNKAIFVFCADNGVVQQGVTQCDSEVTAKVAESISNGTSAVCRMANAVNSKVTAVDVGICRDVEGEKIINKKISYGTRDFTLCEAMNDEELNKALEVGIEMAYGAKRSGVELAAAGEMGIGNTTTTAAVCSVLLDIDPEKITGRGAGLNKLVWNKKVDVIKRGIAKNKPDKNNPYDVLQKVGGYDIAAITGFYIGCAAFKLPVLLDGIITAAAALAASKINEKIIDYILPSHVSAEPLGKILLDRLNKKPLICAELRLGEGTGAVAAMALYDLAYKIYSEMSTFKSINMEPYKRFND